MKKSTEIRSDHLLAIVNYVYDQMRDGNIPVLDQGDNEQGLNLDEQIEYIEQLQSELERLTVDGHCDLTVSKE